MKENYFITSKKLFLFLLMVSFSGYSQISGAHFTITLANPTNPTSSSFEVDVVLVVDPTGTALAQGGSRISGVSVGVMFNPSILNGGTPSTLTNGGVWTLIPGTRDASLAGLSFAQDGTYRGIFNNYGQLRIVGFAKVIVKCAPEI